MKYPLCKRAGLEIHQHSVIAGISRGKYEFEEADFIRAADVEKLLEGATKVYRNSIRNWSESCDDFDTETARLIMIEPIVKDTPTLYLKSLRGRPNDRPKQAP